MSGVGYLRRVTPLRSALLLTETSPSIAFITIIRLEESNRPNCEKRMARDGIANE
jgi:hypothetical protein